MVNFTIPKKDFLLHLKQLKSPVTVRRNDVYFIRCELLVLSDKVVIKLPGNEIYLPIPTIGLAKSTFFFKDFQIAVEKAESKLVTITIDKKTIKINQITLTSDTEFFNKKEAKIKSEMPMEFLNETPLSNVDQNLDLIEYYTSKDRKTQFLKQDVMRDLTYIYVFLEKYGFQKSEVKDFLGTKIHF